MISFDGIYNIFGLFPFSYLFVSYTKGTYPYSFMRSGLNLIIGFSLLKGSFKPIFSKDVMFYDNGLPNIVEYFL